MEDHEYIHVAAAQRRVQALDRLAKSLLVSKHRDMERELQPAMFPLSSHYRRTPRPDTV